MTNLEWKTSFIRLVNGISEVGGECWFNYSENKPMQKQVMPLWTTMYLSLPHTFITHFTICQTRYQANPVHSMSSWTKLYVNDLEIVSFTHLRKGPKTYLPHVTIKTLSILFSILLLWSTLLSFTLYSFGPF